MNTGSDNLLLRAEEKVETARAENTDMDIPLVELGKVSDTRGGWFGSKLDSGVGLAVF